MPVVADYWSFLLYFIVLFGASVYVLIPSIFPLPLLSLPTLRVSREEPGQSRASPGGVAGRLWRRKGAGASTVYSSSRLMLVLFGVMPVLRSSVLDLLDQIQGVLVVLRPPSELQRLESKVETKIIAGISLNKVRTMGCYLVHLYSSGSSSYPYQRGAGGNRGQARPCRRDGWW